MQRYKFKILIDYHFLLCKNGVCGQKEFRKKMGLSAGNGQEAFPSVRNLYPLQLPHPLKLIHLPGFNFILDCLDICHLPVPFLRRNLPVRFPFFQPVICPLVFILDRGFPCLLGCLIMCPDNAAGSCRFAGRNPSTVFSIVPILQQEKLPAVLASPRSPAKHQGFMEICFQERQAAFKFHTLGNAIGFLLWVVGAAIGNEHWHIPAGSHLIQWELFKYFFRAFMRPKRIQLPCICPCVSFGNFLEKAICHKATDVLKTMDVCGNQQAVLNKFLKLDIFFASGLRHLFQAFYILLFREHILV